MSAEDVISVKAEAFNEEKFLDKARAVPSDVQRMIMAQILLWQDTEDWEKNNDKILEHVYGMLDKSKNVEGFYAFYNDFANAVSGAVKEAQKEINKMQPGSSDMFTATKVVETQTHTSAIRLIYSMPKPLIVLFKQINGNMIKSNALYTSSEEKEQHERLFQEYKRYRKLGGLGKVLSGIKNIVNEMRS